MLIQISYDCRATTCLRLPRYWRSCDCRANYLLLILYKNAHEGSWLNRQTSVHAFCNRKTVRDNPAGQCFLDRLVNGSIWLLNYMLSSEKLRICMKVYMYLQSGICVYIYISICLYMQTMCNYLNMCMWICRLLSGKILSLYVRGCCSVEECRTRNLLIGSL